MSIRITEIHLQQLGPLSRFDLKPGALNVIYGRNERGKTLLVEFFLRSLFRNAKAFKPRPAIGNGRLILEGLDKKSIAFSPTSPKKIEDFWEQNAAGLPVDFSRLIVVKGAEVELSSSEGGADKSLLAQYLSGLDTLDRILKRIPKTVQDSKIEGTTILGPKRGELDNRAQLEEQVKTAERLFIQIDQTYSGGPRKKESDEKAAVEAELALLEKARQHSAFLISQKIKSLKAERGRMDEETVKTLRQRVYGYHEKTAELREKRKGLAVAEKKSEHYEWLKSARDCYREWLNASVTPPKPFLLVLSVLFGAAAVVFVFLRLVSPTVFSMLAAFALAGIYLFRLRQSSKAPRQSDEMHRISKEFRQRFKQDLTGLPQLEEMFNRLGQDYTEARLLNDQIQKDAQSLERQKSEIASLFSQFTDEIHAPESWKSAVKKIEEKLGSLTDALHENERILSELGVDPREYEERDPGVPYDKTKHKSLQGRLDAILEELKAMDQRLVNLKQQICLLTQDDISTPLDSLIQRFQAKHEEIRYAYRDKTAEIIGKITVAQVLESIRKDEDHKIESALNLPGITGLLETVTGRYKSLHLDGQRLLVSDGANAFGLSELSTGAREQVLLALRIGMASKLLGQERLFLIFDDAFQYSDWERRGFLVDTVVGLAKQGWQIFYFTMDDHIRELFDEKGKEFGKEYVKVELK